VLGPGRYLLGAADLLLLAGFASLGAAALRRRLAPDLNGPPAWLATIVLAAALLILSAELLGSFSAFKPLLYLVLVGAIGLSLRVCLDKPESAAGGAVGADRPEEASATAGAVGPLPRQDPRAAALRLGTFLALAVAALAVLHFALDVKTKLGTGMTGFDSTWYHGPFAAGFLQSGSTWDLHFIAPQFQAWFYPANAEIFHAAGMLAFHRDLLSPLLNLGWLLGCLLACWCVGRPYGAAPWALALGAVALSVPALADQAGEARNDMPGIFFLLAGAAVALNGAGSGRGLSLLVGLAAGLAAGTKLDFLLPGAVLVVGVALAQARGERLRAGALALGAALLGGGYWYLRNLAHAGNPLPWVRHLGPLHLPGPDQPLGGREAHSVLGYLGDGSVWSDWFLPGLHHGLWALWPLLIGLAAAGLFLCLLRGAGPALRTAALAGLAAALAWLVAPTSASGPEGVPRGFESGLRYLAPAIVLGFALLPAAPALRRARTTFMSQFPSQSEGNCDRKGGWRRIARGRGVMAVVAAALLGAIAVGYPIQRHYLENRYVDPTFTSPGLNAAFRWARAVSDSSIATTSTRQFPLFGTDLSNEVRFVGVHTPHAGFEATTGCRAWRRALDAGEYDYVVASWDRIEPGQAPYPPQARWTEGPQARIVLRKPPTVVFKLTGPLDPSGCPPVSGPSSAGSG
jgi:hypothetical protein